jgi:hypothetical protein
MKGKGKEKVRRALGGADMRHEAGVLTSGCACTQKMLAPPGVLKALRAQADGDKSDEEAAEGEEESEEEEDSDGDVGAVLDGEAGESDSDEDDDYQEGSDEALRAHAREEEVRPLR